MADKSAIEWTDATWNPTVGCSIVSPGCTNCYAMKVANGLERRFDSPKYRGLTKVVNGNAVWTGEVRLDEAALLQPLKWKRGRRIFVNSMSDLFHENLSDADIDRVFAVMALCPQHTFQVLTKRAERMRSYLANKSSRLGACTQMFKLWEAGLITASALNLAEECEWPLPNVWLGISCERQEEADERIPLLLDTPAAVRFVSAEPLLGPVDLNRVPFLSGDARHKRDALTGQARMYGTGVNGNPDMTVLTQLEKPMTRLDWVIVGGESGSNARPMHPDWVRSMLNQCEASDIKFFFKQWGAWRADALFGERTEPDGMRYTRMSKKAAGRLLDGREHNAFPVTDVSVTQSGVASHEENSAEATRA